MIDLLKGIKYVGSGVTLTLELLTGAFIIGFVLGGIFSIARRTRVGRPIVSGIVSVLRGTPVLLQLSVIFFTSASLTGIKLSILSAGIVTFGINSAAYVSEIFRSGIESLPRGQFEACQTLEIPRYHTWLRIILPQVFLNTLPSLINEMVALLKETAVVGMIGGMDITRSAQALAAEHYEYFIPLCIAGSYYYVLVMIIEWIGRKIEKKRVYT
ncbi:MAG: amino acid ABC transporter permease [Holosporales bacterium]|jgi:polar amino acid transport system permease protein|nr:amino acid ABC transporter permease [Holosporales bacterium]